MRGPSWIRPSLRRRRGDERGATLIFTAICMVALLGAGAMGVDIGFSVYGSRQAQAMADTAALDLARYINIADQQCVGCNGAVQTYLNGKLANVATDNASNAGLTVTPGLWLNGAWSVPSLGCAPTSPPSVHPCNAVKIVASQTVPQIFWGGTNRLTARAAVAAVTPEAGFTIGSFLLNFDSQQSAVLNDLLTDLGTSANLNAADDQGLANTYVSLNQLVTASGGLLTTSDVMTTSLTAAQWLSIWSDAVANQVGQLNCGASPTPFPCEASTGLSALDFGGSTSAQLCQLVAINGSSCANGTISTAALASNLNVLQILTTEAELANGSNAINVTTALGITGVTAANLYLDLVQLPTVAFGPVGSYTSAAQCPAPSGKTSTCATTAQLSADLQLTVPSLGGVLNIPLSTVSGTATLYSLSCLDNAMTTTNMAATTTTATAAITLAGASVATLTLSGYSGSQAGFDGPGGGNSVVPPTASTASATPSPTNPWTLVPTTTTPSYSGTTGLWSSVQPWMSVVEPLLEPVLQAVGVALGGAQLADLSANCGSVSLVQ
jgi:uncharacterized membrane protein